MMSGSPTDNPCVAAGFTRPLVTDNASAMEDGMRRIDPGMAYTAAILFASDREWELQQDRSKVGATWPWLAVLIILGLSSVVFGIRNPELLASVWNLM